MPKYTFICENDGIIEVIHPMDKPHPTHCAYCGGKIRRYFVKEDFPPIMYVESDGGGVDEWPRKRMVPRQEPTSPEADVKYR